MVKEIERNGIPTVHIATITPISLTIGANRIIAGYGIPHPLGDPAKSSEEQYAMRKTLMQKALKVLQTPITEQTLF